MNFGQALQALKDGEMVFRNGWNGQGMFLYHVPANSYPAQTEVAKEYWKTRQKPLGENEVSAIMVPYGAYVAMKTAQENVVVWTASQTDLLADDWEIMDAEAAKAA